jgi:hypothetical protein
VVFVSSLNSRTSPVVDSLLSVLIFLHFIVLNLFNLLSYWFSQDFEMLRVGFEIEKPALQVRAT